MSKPVTAVKQIRIQLDEPSTGLGAPGLNPQGSEEEGFEFQAVGMYRNPLNPKEYICGVFTIKNGVVVKSQLEQSTLYQIAAMTSKVTFSRLFLSGQISTV